MKGNVPWYEISPFLFIPPIEKQNNGNIKVTWYYLSVTNENLKRNKTHEALCDTFKVIKVVCYIPKEPRGSFVHGNSSHLESLEERHPEEPQKIF